jgi:sigma-B regulation protein RsbU (phosphoserine phosphatase)
MVGKMISSTIEPAVILLLTSLLAVLGAVVFRSRQHVGQLKQSSAEIHQEERRVFDFLHGLGAAFSEGVPSSELHRLIVEGAMATLKADDGALYLADRSGKNLLPSFLSKGCPPLVAVPSGVAPESLESFLRLQAVPIGSGLLGEASSWGEPRFLRRSGDFPEALRSQGLGYAVIGPLVYRQKLLGVLALTRKPGGDPFSDTKIELFKAVAEQSAFALFNRAIHLAAGEKLAMDHDLQVAGEIQKILLPADAPEIAGYEVGGLNLPARTLSGDYFDYIAVDADHVGIAIADVSGKGVPAALIMAMCRSALRSQAPGNLSPAAVLKAVNRQLYPDMKEDMFISMAYVILEPATGSVLMARAGHDAPFLHRANGNVECLNPKGMAVGIDDGGVFDRICADYSFGLESGDLLLLYTDGITEALDSEGEEFGTERLCGELRDLAGEGAGEILHRLARSVRAFAENRPQHDDITLIALRKL